MIVPLYNSECAPPEVRGALVGLQQLAITFGIMISYWYVPRRSISLSGLGTVSLLDSPQAYLSKIEVHRIEHYH